MKLIDLTMPVWPGAAYGEILPLTNTPVEFFEYMVYDRNGMRMTRMKLNGETGSPLMMPTQHAPFEMKPIQPNPRYTGTLDEIPLDQLVLHDTTIIDVPCEERHEITAEEMKEAIANADYHKGDHVLLRTGWGNLERAYELGLDYYKRSPCVYHEAGSILAETMEEMGSGIFMTDCGLVNPPRVQGHNWFVGDSPYRPVPKPWPSMEARERQMEVGTGYPHVHRDPSSYGQLIKKIMGGSKCLVNCHLITKKRVKMIILPLPIRKGGASPCRFVAVEE